MRFAKIFTVLLFAGALAACSSMSAQNQAPQRPSGISSSYFTTMVASSDQFEIDSSKLALKKSHDKSVRHVAKQMIKDHTKSSHEFKALLADNGIRMPPPSLNQHHQQTLDMLASLDSNSFDDQYLKAQETAHKDAITLFQRYSQTGQNPALRDFADKTLPALQKHQQMIEQTLNR